MLLYLDISTYILKSQLDLFESKQRLAKNNMLQNESIMQSPDGILVLSNEERVVYVNSAMLNLLDVMNDDELIIKLYGIKIDQ